MTLLGIILGLASLCLIAGLVERLKESIDRKYMKRLSNSLLDEYLEHHRVY